VSRFLVTSNRVPIAASSNPPHVVTELSSERSVWTDRRIGIALFVGVLAIYVAVLRGRIEAYDTEAMLSVTKNLVDHGSLTTVGSGWVLGPVSTPYAPYGIGVSILAVPAYLISKVTGHFPVVVSLIAPVITAFCVVCIYRIARSLRWRPLQGVASALAFGLLSMAVWYTVELFSEPGVTLCVLVMVLGLIRWSQGSRWAALWVGLAAACALQLRSDSLFTVWIMLVAAPFFVPWKDIRSRRTVATVFVPMAASVGVLIWYNEIRYKKPIVSSYGPGGGFSTPLWHGLRGLLFSPGKSMFVFNPLTILGVVGLVLLFFYPGVRNRPMAVLMAIAVVPRVLFFAKWGVWDAGSVWGPRFLLPSVAVLSVAIVPVFQATDPRRVTGVMMRVAFAFLAIVAGFVNFLSVRLPLGEWLSIISDPTWRARLGIHGLESAAAQANAIDFSVRYSPIWGYVTILQRGIAITSADLWTSGHDLLGWLLLAFGAAAVIGALIGASSPRGLHSALRSGGRIDEPSE